jgi:hypothetical protein
MFTVNELLNYETALDKTKNPATAAKQMLRNESLSAVKGGAIVGGTVSGVISVGENIAALVEREKKTEDAIIDGH